MGSYWSLGEGRDIFFRGMTTAKLPMFLWVTLLNSVAHKTSKQQQLEDMNVDWEATQEKGGQWKEKGQKRISEDEDDQNILYIMKMSPWNPLLRIIIYVTKTQKIN